MNDYLAICLTETEVSMKARLPKIGIRPVIDGRRKGVREALEDQTMDMACRAAALISDNLRHPGGEKVECVIADTTIGRVAEAVACEEQFEREGVEITLTVTPCWCYGTEVMDSSERTIKAVWGFNGTERSGAVFLAAVLAAHSQKGLPAFSIYGRDVQDADEQEIPEDVKVKILQFAKAAIAAVSPRGRSYLSIGSVSMGIAGSYSNPDIYQEYFGMRSEQIDSMELQRRIDLKIYDEDEFEKAMAWVRENCQEGIDINPEEDRYSPEEKADQWETSVKMMMIFRDLMQGNEKLAEKGFVEESVGHAAIVGGFQGQRQWTDNRPNADFAEAMLNSSFDWNGIREAIPFATENDTLNGLTMMMGHLLTDAPSIFADVRTYWSPDAVKRVTGRELKGAAGGGIIHLLNSGAATLDGTGVMTGKDGKPVMKPFWEISDEEAKACLDATEWCPANVYYFRGGGFSSHYKTGTRGGMPLTMMRLNNIKGLGLVMQLAEGYSVELEKDVHDILEKRTDPTWPTTWFAPIVTGKDAFKDVYSVMANWGANHAALVCGHVGHLVLTLCSMLRIPVNMHNVSEDRIFRPGYWAAFGTKDLEGADYRACAALGPLYRTVSR